MAKAAVVHIVPTVGHSVGIAVGNSISADLDVVTGYLAARDPVLIEARKVANLRTRAALTAKLLADLS